MRVALAPILLAGFSFSGALGSLEALQGSQAGAAQTGAGVVGSHYAILVLEGLPSLTYNEEEISPNGQWVIAGSLVPTTSNPYYLLQISETPGKSPSVVGVTDLYSFSQVTAAQTAHGITPFGSTAPSNPEPSIGACGTSDPLAQNSSGIVVGTTYLQPPNGGPLQSTCGAFVYSAHTGSELLSNLLGNANFFAYRGQGIADNGFIVGDGLTQRNFSVAYLAYPMTLPTITSVTPDVGTVDGGTSVTIQGSNFNTNAGSTGFVFGVTSLPYLSGKPATNVDCTTTTLCTMTTPTGNPGTYDVYASTGVGYSEPDPTDDDFTYIEVPEISSVTPKGGPLAGGNTVIIHGSGFNNSSLPLTTVDFDLGPSHGTATLVAGGTYYVLSDSEIRVTAPDARTAADGSPTLYTSLALTFTDAEGARISSVTSTPTDAAYAFGVPVIRDVDPGGGPLDGGNRIVISGSGFEGYGLGALTGVVFAAATVTSTRPTLKVGPTDVTVVSASEIVVTEAPDATTPTNHDSTFASSVSVVFKAADGTITHSVPDADGANDYFFGAPVIDSLSPTAGPATGGNTIIVHGSGFENPALQLTSVAFTTGNETGTVSIAAQHFTVVADDEMKITSPDASDELETSALLDTYLYVRYKVKDEDTVTVTSEPLHPGDNEYVYGVPLIESVDPEGGPLDGGNSIVLKGSGFDNADLSLKSIDFYAADSGTESDSGTGNTAPLLEVTCVSADTCDVVSDTEIEVVAPTATDADTTGDAVLSTEITAVFTENESGEEIDSQPLEKGDNDYVFGAPVVDSVTPEGGSLDGGTTILIDGSGFEDPGLTLESVAFAPLDDTDESDTLFASDTDVTILSDTQIEVKTPDASGPAGTSPTLDTEVTVVFSDETERTVLSVPAAQGDNDYTFGAPVVTAIDPEGGPVEGGNTITVLGSGFDDPDLQLTSVSFEAEGDTGGSDEVSVDGSAIHVLSNTEIQVVAPDVTDQLTEGQDLLLTAVTAHFTTDDDTAVESVPASVGDNLYTFGAPTVDSVAPDDGPLGGGNTITINGSGFDEPGLTLTGVNFDPNGDSEGSAAFSADPDQIDIVSDTEIKVTAPDATAAADGEPHLQTTVTVTFADTEGSKIDSVPSAEGANEYTYNESATITQVDMYGGSSDPTIVVFGSGFGTEPSAVSPCMSGGEDFANDDLSFGDLTTLTGAGAVGDCIGLDVSTYTETEIEFTLGAGYSNYPVVAAGDQFTVDVYGAIYTGTVSWNAQTIQFTSSPPSPRWSVARGTRRRRPPRPAWRWLSPSTTPVPLSAGSQTEW